MYRLVPNVHQARFPSDELARDLIFRRVGTAGFDIFGYYLDVSRRNAIDVEIWRERDRGN